ncbi:hypothetical protein ACH5RR_040275 [Cinchona calisaya]|uniref:Homeobox domain-containing protein n=1 Tax=Cinchona calisaya TaxID=153742 RepID=A0ABD2XSH0_9GENT
MMVGKEDLGLSLSLSFPDHENQTTTTTNSSSSYLQLNLMPSLTPAAASNSSPFANLHQQKTSWNDTFPSSDRSLEGCRVETRTFFKGIDVNRLPPAAAATADDGEEEAGVSSPNSTLSSISGKRSERGEANGEDLDLERASSRGISDEEDGDNSRKKLRLSKDQSAILEESFKEHNTLNPKQKLALAKRLGLRPRQVEVWFQNRRARTKLKQTEVDCEYLKRCCESLTEENRRLQKEVQELRTLKLSPQFYMQMTPPTTLTMCPSCERVGAPPSSSSTVPIKTPVDPRTRAMVRPIPFNPWATTPIPHRPFDGLHSRS